MAENSRPDYKEYILTEKEKRRYKLQLGMSDVGLRGQEMIKKSKILVVGAGGRGSAVIQNLIAAGVGLIGICDNGIISEENLISEQLFGDKDLGKHKAIVIKQKLTEINKMVEIRLHNIWLTETNVDSIFLPYDILVDASNNNETHYLINDSAIRMKKPFILGFTNIFEAHIAIFNYNNGPSLRDLFKNSFENVISGSGNNFVSPISLVTISGAIMANEVLKLILGLETPLNGNLLTFNCNTYQCSLKSIIKRSG